MRKLVLVILMVCLACGAADAEKPKISDKAMLRMSQIEKDWPGGAWERLSGEKHKLYFYTADIVDEETGVRRVLHWTFIEESEISGDEEMPHKSYLFRAKNFTDEKFLNDNALKYEKLDHARPMTPEELKDYEKILKNRETLKRLMRR